MSVADPGPIGVLRTALVRYLEGSRPARRAVVLGELIGLAVWVGTAVSRRDGIAWTGPTGALLLCAAAVSVGCALSIGLVARSGHRTSAEASGQRGRSYGIAYAILAVLCITVYVLASTPHAWPGWVASADGPRTMVSLAVGFVVMGLPMAVAAWIAPAADDGRQSPP